MSAHSLIAPSSAKAWRYCAMQPTMSQRYPQEDSPEALEGNAAHWVAWEMLEGVDVKEGDITPNGHVVTDEMIDGGELLREVIRSKDRAVVTHVEERLAIPTIHEQAFGTPDFWQFFDWTIDLIDYKFGHRFVDEFENDQGVMYTEGILDLLSHQLDIGPGKLDQLVTVNFTIVQPRCYYKGLPVRTWTFKAHQIRGQLNILKAAAEQVFLPNPIATTNSECIDCPGRHACPALQQAAYSDAEFSTQSVPLDLTAAAASLELRMLERAQERLNARVDGLRESVIAQLRRGQSAPYHALRQGYGNLKWTVPTDDVLAMGKLMGKDLRKLAIVTPTQAKNLGIDESVISLYSEKPLGKISLVQEDSKNARRVFNHE